jgi:hypothetical protein
VGLGRRRNKIGKVRPWKGCGSGGVHCDKSDATVGQTSSASSRGTDELKGLPGVCVCVCSASTLGKESWLVRVCVRAAVKTLSCRFVCKEGTGRAKVLDIYRFVQKGASNFGLA